MKRTTEKLPNDLEAIESRPEEVARRHLIAAKAGRSGRRDTARRIEEIIRKGARRSR